MAVSGLVSASDPTVCGPTSVSPVPLRTVVSTRLHLRRELVSSACMEALCTSKLQDIQKRSLGSLQHLEAPQKFHIWLLCFANWAAEQGTDPLGLTDSDSDSDSFICHILYIIITN